jgi:hypothetical protein
MLASAFLLALLGISVILGGCGLRSPKCTGEATAPIDPAVVESSLEQQGLDMRNLTRSAECGADDITATLEDEEEGLTVRCVVRNAPIYVTGRVIRLADSPDGAAHLGADNVECFVDTETSGREQVIADVRAGLVLMLRRVS